MEKMMLGLFGLGFLFVIALANDKPVFIHDMNNLRIPENAQPGSVVYQLVGTDNESEVKYGIEEADNLFNVDGRTGVVTLLTKLDHQTTPVVYGTVTLEDLQVDGPTNKISKRIQIFVTPVESQDFQPEPTFDPVILPELPTEPDHQIVTIIPEQLLPQTGAPAFSVPDVNLKITENWPVGVALPIDPELYVAALGNEDTVIQLSITGQADFMAELFSLQPSQINRGGEFEVVLQGSFNDYNGKLLKLNHQVVIYIEATDNNNGATNVLPIYLEIVDFNDHMPRFEKAKYLFTVPSKIEDVIPVGTVTATDEDRGQFGTEGIVFHLFGQFAKHFQLSSSTAGTVQLKMKPCKGPKNDDCVWNNLPPKFTLVLRAADTNGTGLHTDVYVEISVEKNNIYSPKFVKPYYMATLREQSTEFEPLLQVSAIDKDGSPINYSLDDPTNLFDIENKTGIIFIRHPDFVTVDNLGMRFNLTAMASDGLNPPSKINIILEVLEQKEAKNRPPTFASEKYEFAVQPKQTVVGFVSAVDTEGPVQYHIAEGGAGYFSIDPESGQLGYNGHLLRDMQHFQLKVVAVDSGRPPMVDSTLVDVTVQGLGSVPPKFLNSQAVTVSMLQTALPGKVLHKFEATDPDAGDSILYRISALKAFNRLGGQAKDPDVKLPTFFVFGAMGKNNGTLFLAMPFNMDNVMSIHIIVAATDTAHPDEPEDEAFLVINIVPVAPLPPDPNRFLQFESLPPKISVPQSLSVGSYVYTVKIRTLPDEIKEKVGKIKFNLAQGREFFSINEKTGVIRLVKPLTEPGKDVRNINVTVRVTHTSTGESRAADIDVLVEPENSHSPKFQKSVYEATVREDSQVGTVVLTVSATDSDGGKIAYTLAGRDAKSFTIDGKGQIRTAVRLNRENKDSFEVQLVATDSGGRTAHVPVHVQVSDANEHSPVFDLSQYSASIMENSPIGSHLLQVQATDIDSGDNGLIRYSLINVQPELVNILSIDSVEGVVRNNRPLTGLSGKYPFAAAATDGGGMNASVPLFLTINPTTQCQPEFVSPIANNSIIAINENGPEYQIVTKFDAKTSGSDSDCDVSYVIWDDNIKKYVHSTDQFDLNSKTGELKAKMSFDREQQTRYALIVAAQSGSLHIQTAVEIQILDLNDNKPEFGIREIMWNVREDVVVGTAVGNVQAKDHDSAKFSNIYYHLIGNDLSNDDIWPVNAMFKLGIENGRLSVRKELDREMKYYYKFWILATNEDTEPSAEEMKQVIESASTRSDVVSVIVKVDDVNDNGPVFDLEEYLVAAPEQAPIGHVLTKVRAQDPDSTTEEEPVTVLYRIAKTGYYNRGYRDSPGLIKIDQRSGEVKVAQDIKDYTQGHFVVTVNSADFKNVSQAQSDSTKIKIWVYKPDQLVRVVVAEKPEDISNERINYLTTSLGNVTDAIVVLRKVEYHSEESGLASGDHVDLLVIFVNKTTQEILPVKYVINKVDKEGLKFSVNKRIKYIMAATAALKQEQKPKMSIAAIALIVFGCLLCIGLLGFLLLVCLYRYSFIQEKKTVSEKPPKHIAPIKPPPTPFRENPLWSDPTQKPYDVQELSLRVGSENGSMRPRYSSQPSYYSIPSYDDDQTPMTEFSPQSLRGQPQSYAQVQKTPSRHTSEESGWYETVDRN